MISSKALKTVKPSKNPVKRHQSLHETVHLYFVRPRKLCRQKKTTKMNSIPDTPTAISWLDCSERSKADEKKRRRRPGKSRLNPAANPLEPLEPTRQGTPVSLIGQPGNKMDARRGSRGTVGGTVAIARLGGGDVKFGARSGAGTFRADGGSAEERRLG